MAKVFKIVEVGETDPDGAEWLHGLDDRIIACRGDHHDWPVLRPGKLPRGIKAMPQSDGGYQLTITCRGCGRQRTRTTLPGGLLERGARYGYKDPKGYKAPRGLGLTRQDYVDELWRRIVETLRGIPVATKSVPAVKLRAPGA
jgi:hypothetical protein